MNAPRVVLRARDRSPPCAVELDQEKLTPLLRLKYHNSIADAVAELGRPEEIGRVFAGFQKYLYQQQAPRDQHRRPPPVPYLRFIVWMTS